MRKIILMSFLYILIGCQLLFAQSQNFRENVSKRGTTAANFLEIGVGARAIGMGGAFTALAADPSAMFWNVGGISKIGRTSLFFNHSEWIADTNFDFVAGIFPVNEIVTIGVSVTALNMADMEVTTVLEPEGTGQMFDAGDYSFGLAVALNLTERFSIGLTPKYIHQFIWDMEANGFAIDLGVHYITPFKGITIGFAMTNFGPKMQMDGQNNRVLYDYDPNSTGNNERVPAKLETSDWALPLNFRIGFLYHAIQTENHQAIIEVDAQHPNNNYESVNLGFEYILLRRYAIRAGYKSLFLSDSEESFTIGAGLNYPIFGNVMIHVDYAFADYGILNNVHKFSLGLDF
jgi:hypothetical protein